MRPSLPEALAALAGEGASAIRIVPVFFGAGGHVKEDLPRLVESFARRHPACRVEIETAIGEREAVLESIAELIAGE